MGVSIVRNGPYSWEAAWIRAARSVGRLRRVYSVDEPMGNVDVEAVVDGCLIFLHHMWDAFLNDETLAHIGKAEVNEALQDPMLALCRDYSNTAKHLRRRGDGERTAIVVEHRNDHRGRSIVIGYGPIDDLGAHTIDALSLAEGGFAAWVAWMERKGVVFPNQARMQDLMRPDFV